MSFFWTSLKNNNPLQTEVRDINKIRFGFRSLDRRSNIVVARVLWERARLGRCFPRPRGKLPSLACNRAPKIKTKAFEEIL
jgi:hypothetical protein